MPQIQYIDEVVDVPVQKHRLVLNLCCEQPDLFKQPFNCYSCYSKVTLRQVPVPVKQQKHIEARCAVHSGDRGFGAFE